MGGQIESGGPKRVIGGLDAFSIVAGSMIGAGIFVYTSNIAAGTGSLPLFFAMILLGGFFAMAGAVACGELGAMMPEAGGDYIFQRAAFGPSLAFASGWVLFVAIFAGSAAALAIDVVQYDVGPLLGIDMRQPLWGGGPEGFTRAHGVAILIVILFTFINDMGTALSARTQTILTFTPIVLLVAFGLYIFIFQPEIMPPTEPVPPVEPVSFRGLAKAFLAVNFIFSGWINIMYVASEVRNPGKTIPWSMFSATTVVTLLYLFLGGVFVYVLGLDGLANLRMSDAGTATAVAVGVNAKWILLVITVAILTSINATILGAARVGTAMASHGAFWRPIAKLSGKHGSPRRALWFHALMAVVLIATGTSHDIVEMASLAMFVTGSLTVSALFVLRRKLPDKERPYRATAYPFLPAVYILFAVAAVAAMIWGALSPEEGGGGSLFYPLLGLGILAVAWFGHAMVTRLGKRS